MPHPARIRRDQLVATASTILEEDGLEGLSMRELARRLDVRAPSLYFHVESRDDLLRELIGEALADLGRRLRVAAHAGGAPRQVVHRMARAYLAFAEDSPQRFALTFGPCPIERQPREQLAEDASAPVLEVSAALVGDQDALFFSEALWSLVHGYALLRLADQFRINPDHDRGFDFALDLLIDAAEARRARV